VVAVTLVSDNVEELLSVRLVSVVVVDDVAELVPVLWVDEEELL
jgi:hypothetical protein